MLRLVRLISVLSIVGVSAQALACDYRYQSGVGVQLGGVFFGFSKHRRAPCPAVVIAPPTQVQPLPPVAYYTQPQVVYAPPPQPVYVAPPPPQVVYTNPPIVYAQPPPPPVVQQRAAPPPAPVDDKPNFLALKYMPGVSSAISTTQGDAAFGTPSFTHSPGIEARLTRWLSLRSDLEFRREGRTWDMLGVKLSLLPNSPVKPYASVSFSGNENYSDPGKYSFGFVGAAGLDVMIGKYFFLEAEARYRVTPGACCSTVPSLTGLIGGGVAFF